MDSRIVIIDGKETGYRIYEDGRLYSDLSSKFLRNSNTRGYNTYSLRVNSKTITRYAHKLVAEMFLGFEPNKEVNHIDGNKLNNSLSNLEWVSKSDNIKHAYSLGLATASTEQIKRPILQFNKDTGELVREYETIKEAALALGNINKMPNIIRACQGKQQTSYGYRWEYKDGKREVKWNEL